MSEQESMDKVPADNQAKAQQNVKSHFDNVKEALELLYVHFPKAFIKEGDLKPLKLGIFDDLKLRIEGIEGLSITKVRAALRIYTTRLKYLYSVKEGAMRIDLDGNEIEAVTGEHAEYAKKTIEEISAKLKPKKPAKKFVKNKDGQNGRRSNFTRKKFDRKNNKPYVREAVDEQDLVEGRQVLVSNSSGYIKAEVVKRAQKGVVTVKTESGLTLTNLAVDRVKLLNK